MIPSEYYSTMIEEKMADSIMMGIFQSPNESKSIEFKPCLSWPSKIKDIKINDKAQEIIKSIMAMSNLRDGGKIIIGIERQNNRDKYLLMGLSAQDIKTYDQDRMFDQIRNFSNPEPSYQIDNIKYEKKNFIVISVQSFEHSPLICNNRNNYPGFEHGAIYIRTDKPETKRINNPHEMRELIELTLDKEFEKQSKRFRKYFGAPIKAEKKIKILDDADRFKAEIDDLKK